VWWWYACCGVRTHCWMVEIYRRALVLPQALRASERTADHCIKTDDRWLTAMVYHSSTCFTPYLSHEFFCPVNMANYSDKLFLHTSATVTAKVHHKPSLWLIFSLVSVRYLTISMS